MKKATLNILCAFFILSLAGCNIPGNATPVPVSPVPTAVPEPLPTGYMALLEERIASGEWTLETGLVTMLKMFVGELRGSEAGLGEGVLETEGTGILLLANIYLQTGTDQVAKDEITRLLTLLVPTQEALDRFSIPEEQASARLPGRAAPPLQDPEACNNLWTNGFPDERTPSFVCFRVGQQDIHSSIYRIYFPIEWVGDASRDAYYTATQEAILDSDAIYRPLGTLKAINFIFTTLGSVDGEEWAAETFTAFFNTGTEACPVLIHPSAMDSSDAADNYAGYKQIIAHEIFHCYQAWNLGTQEDGAYPDSNWWVEGTAVYFSNLVYPTVNAEYQFLAGFSLYSTVKPLMSMDYENFAFFQFMGNRIGAEGVIALLRTLPTTPGRDAQTAAMAAVPGMEETFEAFVLSLLDEKLLDSDNSTKILLSHYTDKIKFTDLASKDFSSQQPFAVARYLIEFESEKGFTVETRLEGTGLSAWRGTSGGWGPAPETATGGCEDLQYMLYAITTTPGAERTETVTTTSVTEAPCDECLIGEWEATEDSFLAYMQSVVSASSEDAPTVESVTGTAYLQFRAGGTGKGGYTNLKMVETFAGAVAGAESIITFDGFTNGPYTADGFEMIGLAGGITTLQVTVEIFVGGVSLGTTGFPVRPEDFPVSATIPTPYTCGGDTLFTWPPVEGIDIEPVMWIRTTP